MESAHIRSSLCGGETSFLRGFRGLDAVAPDLPLVLRGVELKALHGIHFHDAMMVAAAERAEAAEFWSEDLNPGQRYAGILVRNPFRGD